MLTKPGLGLFTLLLVLLAAGCGGGGSDETGSSATTTLADTGASSGAQAPAPVDSAGPGGTVAGSVRLAGDPPERATIEMGSDQFCKAHHGTTPPQSESIITNPDGTLRNVFVYVKEGLPAGLEFAPPGEPQVLNQKGCVYQPHVLGIMVGQPLRVLNSDETLHNVRSLSKNNRKFNRGMPTPNSEFTYTFTRAEVMVKIKCDVHPWMTTYCGVLDHPFHDVTGPDGTFELKDLPAGTYTIEAWHEEFGTQTHSVTVTSEETTEVSFSFRAEA
jgi:hypothetical protein